MKILTLLVLPFIFLQSTFATEEGNFGNAIVNSCSAGVIKLEAMSSSRKAIVATNGHCLRLNRTMDRESSYLNPGETLTNIETQAFLERTLIRIHAPSGTVEVAAKRLIFATMTGTDISLFELNDSYDDLKEKYEIKPLIVSPKELAPKEAVQIQTGYYNRNFNCAFVRKVNLREGPFHTNGALELTLECDIYPGVSGSPIVLRKSKMITGLANTHTSGEGEVCGFNNPCIILGSQVIEPNAGTSFGVSLVGLNSCYNSQIQQFDFARKSCRLGQN